MGVSSKNPAGNNVENDGAIEENYDQKDDERDVDDEYGGRNKIQPQKPAENNDDKKVGEQDDDCDVDREEYGGDVDDQNEI